MLKRRQNRIAESRMTLPVVALYGFFVWLASGIFRPYYVLESSGLTGGAWVQMTCLLLSTALMVVLNNSNALLRVYSRTVSSSFVLLSCAACFLFNSARGSIVSLCVIASCLCAFRSFQDKEATGWTFYAFLCMGLASLAFPLVLVYVPLLWLFMKIQINSLSVRTFAASILGLLTPYWFAAAGLLITHTTVESLVALGTTLAERLQHHFTLPGTVTLAVFTVNQTVTYIFITLLLLTGIIHYWHDSINDKIRTRQLYGCFIMLGLITAIFIPLLPACYDGLLQILIICTSPLIAHFVTLTHTKVTNVAFHVILAVILMLTVFNLWMPSYSFSSATAM